MRGCRLCMRQRQGRNTVAVLRYEPGNGQCGQGCLHAVHACTTACTGFAAIGGRMFRFFRCRISGSLLFHPCGTANPSAEVVTRHVLLRHCHVGDRGSAYWLWHDCVAHLHARSRGRCRRPVQDKRQTEDYAQQNRPESHASTLPPALAGQVQNA